MNEEISHHYYTPQMIPCPNCVRCADHADKGPRINVRNRYYRVYKNGDRVEMTGEEYDRRLIS